MMHIPASSTTSILTTFVRSCSDYMGYNFIMFFVILIAMSIWGMMILSEITSGMNRICETITWGQHCSIPDTYADNVTNDLYDSPDDTPEYCRYYDECPFGRARHCPDNPTTSTTRTRTINPSTEAQLPSRVEVTLDKIDRYIDVATEWLTATTDNDKCTHDENVSGNAEDNERTEYTFRRNMGMGPRENTDDDWPRCRLGKVVSAGNYDPFTFNVRNNSNRGGAETFDPSCRFPFDYRNFCGTCQSDDVPGLESIGSSDSDNEN